MLSSKAALWFMVVGGSLLLIGFLANYLSDGPLKNELAMTIGLFIFVAGVIVEILTRPASIGIKIAASGLGITFLGEAIDMIAGLSPQTSSLIFDIGQWMAIIGIVMHGFSVMRTIK